METGWWGWEGVEARLPMLFSEQQGKLVLIDKVNIQHNSCPFNPSLDNNYLNPPGH